MAAKRRDSDAGQFVLIGAAILVVLSLGVVVYALTRDRGPAKEQGPPPVTKASQQPPPEAASQSPPPKQTPSVAALSVKADDLRKEFALNESAADQKYKNRVLDISGTVSSVIQEPPLVGVLFGNAVNDPLPPIICELDRQQMGLVQAGQKVTIRGTYSQRITPNFIGIIKAKVVR